MPSDNANVLLESIRHKREALAACPEGHPDRAQLAAELAEALCIGYQKTGDVALLKKAIEVERRALALHPEGHPKRALSCENLGGSLNELYRVSGVLDLLDEAIALRREVVALRPPGHVDRASSCADLGNSLYARYQRCGNVTFLDEAIGLHREALALRPPGDAQQVFSYSKLALLLSFRYRRGGDTAVLDEAISCYRETLDLQPPGHPQPATTCVNFGSCLMKRYEVCHDLVVLDEAIKLQREGLDLRPLGHTGRPLSCGLLGEYLFTRYKECGDLISLDEVIKLAREHLSLRPQGHPEWATSCNNLAGALHTRYQASGDISLIDEAIGLQREVLVLLNPGSPNQAFTYNSLGSLLHTRYLSSGDVTLLYEAVSMQRKALELRPKGHPHRARSCGSLACALCSQYNESGTLALLDEVIELEREALTLIPQGHPLRASCCSNLGNPLRLRYTKPRNITLLNEAMELDREALALRPPGHPERAVSCRNLSAALIDSYKQTMDTSLLDKAKELSNYVFKNGPPSEASRTYATLCALSLIPDTPHFSIADALRYLDLSFGLEVDSIEEVQRRAEDNLDLLWTFPSTWTRDTLLMLCRVYLKVVDRLPLVANFVLNTSARLRTLASARHIGTDACVVSVLAEQPSTAVELLDRAHGFIWTQALHQREPEMEGAPPELALELTSLLREMAAPMSTELDESSYSTHHQDHRHKQNTRIQAILREIRAMPGLDRFMLGHTYKTLRNAAHHHPVVLLVAGRDHAFALIISSAAEDQPHALRLDLTSDDLSALRASAAKAGLRSQAQARDHEPAERVAFKRSALHVDHESLRVLANMWRKIVKPVVDHLQLQRATGRSRPRLHWCPNGEFVFLPLHAAGIYQGTAGDQACCSDYFVSSYTPTISTLLRAQAQASTVKKSSVNMLLVGEDCASGPMPRIPSVQKELRGIEAVVTTKQFGRTVEVIRSAATVERVAERAKSAHFLHLACHGIQHWTDALESHFYLSNGPLTISELMNLELDHPWLAYLSACETAKGDAKQPDQVMHLAAAMLFAGFKHVVATMWVMNDDDGPDLAEWFYEELMLNETVDSDAVAYALDGAVQKLRAKESSPKRWAQFIHMGA